MEGMAVPSSSDQNSGALTRSDQAATRVSLLLRLTQGPGIDEPAWQEFVRHYEPLLHGWCRRWALQEADAQDVTQQVLLQLARKLAHFKYDPALSFRAWLRTLAHHAWRDFVEAQRRPGRGSGNSEVLEFLASVEARDDFCATLEQQADREVLALAMDRVQLRVEPGTWLAFSLTALEGIPPVEVARRLGKRVATVYVARSKVQKLLHEETQRLLDVPGGASAAGVP
jgi:RNA polymerase sigma-70 factor (ECF subfamily)